MAGAPAWIPDSRWVRSGSVDGARAGACGWVAAGSVEAPAVPVASACDGAEAPSAAASPVTTAPAVTDGLPAGAAAGWLPHPAVPSADADTVADAPAPALGAVAPDGAVVAVHACAAGGVAVGAGEGVVVGVGAGVDPAADGAATPDVPVVEGEAGVVDVPTTDGAGVGVAGAAVVVDPGAATPAAGSAAVADDPDEGAVDAATASLVVVAVDAAVADRAAHGLTSSTRTTLRAARRAGWRPAAAAPSAVESMRTGPTVYPSLVVRVSERRRPAPSSAAKCRTSVPRLNPASARRGNRRRIRL
jgi:hypothetical protein